MFKEILVYFVLFFKKKNRGKIKDREQIVDQNCMLAWIVILLNQKVYFVNVYARMSLNRLFDSSCGRRKREKIY